MFHYSYDPETGGLLLNDETPISSKEPRPVYAAEMLLLHMDEMWRFDIQNDAPYMWAEAASYYYRGKLVAKAKGGSLCQAPDVQYQSDRNERGELFPALPYGTELRPVDVAAMVRKNAALMTVIEQSTVKKIYSYYRRYQKKLDCFHVAFSGGKDSVVLLELVKKALPRDAFKVVFGDTGMEFPDTYRLVEAVEEQCRRDGIAFYRAASHFDPHESWRIFGPPSSVLRWCCSVHKSAPQTLTIRSKLGKSNYVGADYVGVRTHESMNRADYEFECYGKKQKGQYSHNSILDWTSAEVWMYIYARDLPINRAYIMGNSRVGCLFCPMGHGKSDYFRFSSYPDEINSYIEIIKSSVTTHNTDTYVTNGGWISRKNGRDLANNTARYEEEATNDEVLITVTAPRTDWREWIKTLGDLPFELRVEETKSGYVVHMPAAFNKTRIGRYFKQVFKKAVYCVSCRVCEANCPYGCINFTDGLKITQCVHCQNCHEIEEGCLAYHSLELPQNGGHAMAKESLNSFADHAPKPEWISGFFDKGDEFRRSSGSSSASARTTATC